MLLVALKFMILLCLSLNELALFTLRWTSRNSNVQRLIANANKLKIVKFSENESRTSGDENHYRTRIQQTF